MFRCCDDVEKDRNTRDHLAWTAGNGNPMHEVCIIRMVTTRVKQEDEADNRIIVK